MRTLWPTAFVIGPPASGKTTIGRAVAIRLRATFRTIDDWTPRGMPMTDAQIEEALTQLFKTAATTNEIIEFCHHDYEQLLARNTYPVFTVARKIIVIAPLSLCKERNQLRRARVRDTYIERACRSAQSLVDASSTRRATNVIVVDTSSQSIDAAVAVVTDFLTIGRGDHACTQGNDESAV
jgi:adenylate kinase family enzyme